MARQELALHYGNHYTRLRAEERSCEGVDNKNTTRDLGKGQGQDKGHGQGRAEMLSTLNAMASLTNRHKVVFALLRSFCSNPNVYFQLKWEIID